MKRAAWTSAMFVFMSILSSGCGGGDNTQPDALDGTDDGREEGIDADAEEEVFVPPSCGNGVTEPGEACDGDDLAGNSCAGLPAGFSGGSLGCSEDCSAFDVSQCVAGTTIQAASCERPDVQAAIDSSGDGDIINVPAGECTWNEAISITDKSLVLIGAGIGGTTVTDDTTADWGQPLIWIESPGKAVRISGFSFRDTGTNDPFGIVMTWCDDLAFRFDHLEFADIRNRAFHLSGTRSHGVVDHCEIVENLDGTFQGLWLAEMDADGAWTRAMSYGTGDAVFLEDTVFDYAYANDAATDCEEGARYVFRHNQVRNAIAGNHGLDSVMRSCLQMEIYANTFAADFPSGVYWGAVGSRGGSAVVFDNTIQGTYGYPIAVTNYRSCCYAGAICKVGSDGPDFGTCDGTNPLDGNTEPRNEYKGWPCKDQIGRGTDQASFPFYEWNNTFNGDDADVYVFNGWEGCEDPQPTDHVKPGRDYYNDTERPGYVPYVYPHPFTLLE